MNSSADVGAGLIIGLILLYGFIILLGLALFVFWIIELIDVCRREFPDSNSKMLWILVVVLAHGLGALIYYFAGKPQGWMPGEQPRYPQYPQQPFYPPPGYYPPAAVPPENRQE